MRIAMVHSFYRSENPSGENNIVLAQVELLKSAGHEVTLVARSSDDGGRLQALAAGWSVASGIGPTPIPELEAFGPDLVHVHNLFPNYGTRWLGHWRGPLVATLHNYRSMCANSLFLRDGKPCTLCPDNGTHHAVRHRCYRGSAIATLPLAFRGRGGLTADPLVNRADRIIALSPRALDIFRRYGASERRLRLLPNGIDDLVIEQGTLVPSGWASIGRIDVEKGFPDLLRYWPQDQDLTVWGGGPLLETVRKEAGPRVSIQGHVLPPVLRAVLPSYCGVIFAGSAWEGGIPVAVLEVLAAGVPVVAFADSAAAEVVRRFGCGVVYDAPDREVLAGALDEVRQRRGELGSIARRTYEQNFDNRRWLRGLITVYDEAIASYPWA